MVIPELGGAAFRWVSDLQPSGIAWITGDWITQDRL